MKQQTIWFVEPLDQNTNLVIAVECDEDDAMRDVLCADGEKHDLWRCRNYRQITFFKSMHGIHFNVWRQKGGGKIERISFDNMKRQAKRKRERPKSKE